MMPASATEERRFPALHTGYGACPQPPGVTTIELWEQQRAELVGRRMSDLRDRLHGAPLERLVEQLYAELDARALAFRPPVELDDGWRCPAAGAVITVPFYLADPVLAALEAESAGAADAGREPMMLLRHHAGHAFASAYRLNERPAWRERFGPASRPRLERFHADPLSRDFVRHLPGWLAQKHPNEDFAETFAAWLAPPGEWREAYARWPALRKLEYVDRLAHEIGPHLPARPGDRRPDASIEGLHYAVEEPYRYCEAALFIGDVHRFDADLRNIFRGATGEPDGGRAADFIAVHQPELAERVVYWTGEAAPVVHAFLDFLGRRAAALELRAGRREAPALVELTGLATASVMNYRHAGAIDGADRGSSG